VTRHAPPSPAPAGADPGHQVAQLREALALVQRIAGRSPARVTEALLEEAAQVSGDYEGALPVVQRRFDALAIETSAWAAAGVEALLAAGARTPPRAAAGRLADQLERAIGALTALLGR
jgi:hypothetical protein